MDIETFKELNYQKNIMTKFGTNLEIKKSISDICPDFNWLIYKELNPYLYLIGLKDEKEYIHNYLVEGRYKGRIYKYEQKKDFSYHVLLATIGKSSIFNILKMLGEQLNNVDYLTIVYDGIQNTSNIEEVKSYTNNFKCHVNIIVEEKNLGYWGHGIRNKHNDLLGDFVFHIDDDDIIFEDSFDHIRKHCRDTNILYIFKIMLENDAIIWKNKEFKYSQVSTQSGIIPTHMNKNGFWELKYGGDFNYYVNLAKKYNILFIDKLIYRKIGDKKKLIRKKI